MKSLAKIEFNNLELTYENTTSYFVSKYPANDIELPKYLVKYDPETDIFTIPEWLAKEKGLL